MNGVNFDRLLQQDFSEGTDTFRDSLLARCLEALNRGDATDSNAFESAQLTDADLDLIAAAGIGTAPPHRS